MLDELFIRGGPVLYVLFFITLLIFYILIDKYNFLLLNSKDWLNNQLSKFKDHWVVIVVGPLVFRILVASLYSAYSAFIILFFLSFA